MTSSWHVYSYNHIDELGFIGSPGKAFGSETDVERLLGEVKAELLKAGWEGDGAIGVIWLPPFLDFGNDEFRGSFVWHVKQRNNGTSFLASDVPLPFGRLRRA